MANNLVKQTVKKYYKYQTTTTENTFSPKEPFVTINATSGWSDVKNAFDNVSGNYAYCGTATDYIDIIFPASVTITGFNANCNYVSGVARACNVAIYKVVNGTETLIANGTGAGLTADYNTGATFTSVSVNHLRFYLINSTEGTAPTTSYPTRLKGITITGKFEIVDGTSSNFDLLVNSTSRNLVHKVVDEDWVQTTLPTANKNWYSVTYGNGKFVAVDFGSSVASYSTDGINWTQTTMSTIQNWISVTYGNKKFVAVAYSSNVAAYSTDGITWTSSTLPSSAYWRSVTYGNGKFVAVADTTVAAYSTDGIAWTKATMPSSVTWTDVIYANGVFVAVAANSNISAYSNDGITWTSTTISEGEESWGCVVYGNGIFYAIPTTGNTRIVAAYSTDGINWTATKTPLEQSNWSDIAFGDGKFIAILGANISSSVAAYSTDCINWTKMTMPATAWWQSIDYGDDTFVAIARNSNIAAYKEYSDKLCFARN